MNKFTKDMLRTGDRVTKNNGCEYIVSIGGTHESFDETEGFIINTNVNGGWDRLCGYNNDLKHCKHDEYSIKKIERCTIPQCWIRYLDKPDEWRTIWERKEEPRVTAGEIEAFKAIKVLYPKARYISRSYYSGNIYVYNNKPTKNEQKQKWSGTGVYVTIYDQEHICGPDLYPSIKWEDDEPVDMDAEIARTEKEDN